MAYTKTVWVDGSAPAISAANLNNIEQGVADSLRTDGTTTMTGQLVTVAGSATTPAIAPTGDSNNGIFFPAVDTIALGTAGSERIRVTSAGNVGIGTTAPTAKLDVRGAGEIAKFCGTNTSNTYITFGDGTTQFGDVGYDARDTNAFSIFNGQSGPLIFGAVSERMRITSTGNVGIGTTSPSAALHISSATGSYAPSLRITNTSASAGYQSVLAFYTDNTTTSPFLIGKNNVTDTATVFLSNQANSSMIFETNATTRMVITGAGNVGIGTTSPSAKLELSDGTVIGQIDTISSSLYVGTKSNHPLVLFTNNTEKMRLTTAGNVGIGTTSPTYKTEIHGSDTGFNPLMVVNNTNTGIGGNYSYLQLQSNNGTNKLNIGIYNTNDGKHAFLTNVAGADIRFESGTGAGAEKMRLINAGYLLIGYTSSNGAYPLQVNGQIFATSSTIATSDMRYKENVTPLTGALDLVNALNPVQFDWKQHPVHNFNTEQPTVGFLAQEVAEVLKDQPYLNSVIKKSECTWQTETGEFVEVTKQVEVDGELVDETVQEAVKQTHTEEFYGIAESNLIAILTKAVQELSAEVQALKAQISVK